MHSTRTTLPLAQIDRISPLNPRCDDRSDVSSLRQTIKTTGLQYPLLVRRYDVDEAGGDRHEVLEGGRRFRALQDLSVSALVRYEGEPEWRVDLDAIPVLLFEGSDGLAREAILAIATEVSPVHPADLFECFVKLEADGFDVARIAADFGRTVRDVKGILALGAMAPEIRAAWRAGTISRESAQAFAGAASHDAQRELLAFAESSTWLLQNPAGIRRRLAGDCLRADAPEAIFVGAAAYAAAGGLVDEDLFTPQAEIIFRNGTLLKRLAREKLMTIANEIAAAEGWGIATIDDDGLDPSDVDPDYTDAEQERLEQIMTEIRGLDWQADQEAIAALLDEQDAIEAKGMLRAVPQAERAGLAVLADLNGSGRVELFRAYRPTSASSGSERPARDRDDGDDQDSGGEFDDEIETSDRTPPAAGEGGAKPISNAVRETIDQAIEQAFSDLVAGNIGLALTLAIAAMTCRESADAFGLQISAELRPGFEFKHPLLTTPAEADRRFADVLAACAAAPLADVTTAFAEAIAATIDASARPLDYLGLVAQAMTTRHSAVEAALVRAIDHKAYFAAATKDACVGAIQALGGDFNAAAKAKKPIAAATAAKLAADKAFLPEPLSTWSGRAPLVAPEPVDARSTAQAMAEAIDADERSIAAKEKLADDVGAWIREKMAGGQAGDRLGKLANASRQFQAERETLCSDAEFRDAVTAAGFEIRDYRSAPWIYRKSAPAQVSEAAE